ncbi:RNA polymerase sigma factor [Negadavirga shengliensis]|uniref:RNA polymerase sigma factor n=1 Tax=Negadavirga shengliensis TaxID=1389218 RepID=A0ABV9SWT2_9BACT
MLSERNQEEFPAGKHSDLSLWELVKEGDVYGLEALYSKYSKELFKLGMTIKPDRGFVKDCIHDVFVEVWHYRQCIKATDNVKRYLFKCLSNKIHKEIGKDKKRYREEGLDHFEALLYIEYQDVSSGQDAIDESKRLKVSQAIAGLSGRQREVIRYLFFEELSYEDVSDIMGIHVQSVYTLAWKALGRLKKHLAPTFFLGMMLI